MECRPGIWREDFRVRSFETDPWGRAHARTVTNYLQEAAGAHATHLGVSLDLLRDRGLTWMLSRLRVDLERWPRWHDELRVETWPAAVTPLRALREFTLLDAEGRPIGRAVSAWIVVDLERRRPVRLPREVRNLRPAVSPGLESEAGSPGDRLTAIEELSGSDALPGLDFRVRRLQVDLNGHANQSAYVDWAMEAVPDALYEDREPRRLEIEYRSEARPGDAVWSVARETEPGTVVHRLSRGAGGDELARLRSVWK